MNFDLGNIGKALKATGSGYQLPDDGTAAAAAAPGFTPPPSVNSALEASGSTYRVPEPAAEPPEWTGQAQEAAEAAEGSPGLKNSPIVGLVKKAAGAVAAFYTGGASAAAMNVGGQMLSKNNPQAGAAAGAATKLFGG